MNDPLPRGNGVRHKGAISIICTLSVSKITIFGQKMMAMYSNYFVTEFVILGKNLPLIILS